MGDLTRRAQYSRSVVRSVCDRTATFGRSAQDLEGVDLDATLPEGPHLEGVRLEGGEMAVVDQLPVRGRRTVEVQGRDPDPVDVDLRGAASGRAGHHERDVGRGGGQGGRPGATGEARRTA